MNLSEIKTEVVESIDMQEAIGSDSFISDAELIRYINKGIRKVEAQIHTIYEDYFLDVESLPIIINLSTYSLPDNIYASKIRKIIFSSNSSTYEIKRIKDIVEIEEMSDSDLFKYLLSNKATKSVGSAVTSYTIGTKTVVFSLDHKLEIGDSVEFFTSSGVSRGTDVVYNIVDSKTIVLVTGIATIVLTDICSRIGGEKINLYPNPNSTSATDIKIYFIREAKQLVNDTDICDIPEFEDVVILYARYEILKKEIGNPLLVLAKQELEEAVVNMVDTLQKRVPDDNTEFETDISFYNDALNNWMGE
jgi:hypothetical protein